MSAPTHAALDARSPVPLYHQLADWLSRRIRAGAYPTGTRIPSEPELARRFGIGRPTVRQATDLLVRRHQLERRRGSGTFVIDPPERVDLLSLAGTMASFERTGLASTTEIVAPVEHAVALDDGENPFAGRAAWQLARLTRVADTPVVLERLWLDPLRFPDLAAIDLAGRSLSQLARHHYELRTDSTDQSFRVASAGADVAAQLDVPPGTPLLLVKRRVHFTGARDAVFAELHCRTDQLVFSQTLSQPLSQIPEAPAS